MQVTQVARPAMEDEMAKGQMRSNREIRKPKQSAAKKSVETSTMTGSPSAASLFTKASNPKSGKKR